MATAIIGGLIAHGHKAADFLVVDPNPDQGAALTGKFGVRCMTAPDNGARSADVIVLAVKPQQMQAAAAALLPLRPATLVITIAAGICLNDLARWLGGHANLVRAMPNTPALIHQGVTGLYAADGVDAVSKAHAEQLLGAVGKTLWLKQESLLDAVTAVSGSGPAYVFYAMEAVQDAALSLGLSAFEARTLTLQTFIGAAALAAQSDETPAILRQRVTSKGGTTERALSVMESAGVKADIVEAVRAAAARSRELGDALGRGVDPPPNPVLPQR